MLFLALSFFLTARGEEALSFLVGKAAKPLGQGNQSGFVLALTSARTEGNRVILRVGFRNIGNQHLKAHARFHEDDFRIVTKRLPRPLKVLQVSPQLAQPIPPGGLGPGLATVGEIEFEASSEEKPVYEIHLTGFATLPFELTAKKQFQPPPGPEGKSRSQPGLRLDAVDPKLAVLDLVVSEVRAGPSELSFHLATRNAGRAPLQWKAPLTGGAARFLDAEGKVHRPSKVEGGLEVGLGPKGPWKVGADHSGILVFGDLHPHAMREGRLLFPGFPPMHLTWDGKAARFQMTALGTGQNSSAATQLSAEQKRFEEIVGLFQSMNEGLRTRDKAGYLSAFAGSSSLLASQKKDLELLARLPVRNLRYEVPGTQNIGLDEDGGTSNVRVLLRYDFDGLDAENQFRSFLRCDFVRDPTTKRLVIRALRHEKHPPFWFLGYHAFEATDHFLLFYRPGSVSGEVLQQTIAQCEKSYERLRKLRLPLENRYIAFFLPFKEDFVAFTGRDPNRINGVAATFFEEADGRILTGNRAMYINDERFLVEQNAYGLRDRQTTITHELVHLSLAPSTRPYSPGWLVEGVAMNYAGQATPRTRSALARSGLLPKIDLHSLSLSPVLGKGKESAATVTMHYYLSAEAVAYLRQRFGDEKVLAFYRAFGALSPREIATFVRGREVNERTVPEITIRLTEHLLANHFGLTLDQLDGVVRSRTLGAP